MKIIFACPMLLALLAIINCTSVSAQGKPAPQSARSAANSDTRFIANSIEDDKDAIFLSQKGLERGTEPRVKELAEQMVADHTTMLYSMEQLQNAGGHAPADNGDAGGKHEDAVNLNSKLSAVSGSDFDTMWVSNLLLMHQAKYDELSVAKQTVTNPQLKMAVTEAIPLIRKSLSQLKSLDKYLLHMALQRKKEADASKRAKKVSSLSHSTWQENII